MNDNRFKLITGCWIATYLIEIYCNVGNPQLSPIKNPEIWWRVSRTGVVLHWFSFMSSTRWITFGFHCVAVCSWLCFHTSHNFVVIIHQYSKSGKLNEPNSHRAQFVNSDRQNKLNLLVPLSRYCSEDIVQPKLACQEL